MQAVEQRLLEREIDIICGPGLFAQAQQKALFIRSSGKGYAKAL